MAQPSPIHSWKRMVPWVVSAVKSGAVSLAGQWLGCQMGGSVVVHQLSSRFVHQKLLTEERKGFAKSATKFLSSFAISFDVLRR